MDKTINFLRHFLLQIILYFDDIVEMYIMYGEHHTNTIVKWLLMLNMLGIVNISAHEQFLCMK